MTYRVVITATARHNLKSIPRPIALRIGEELAALAGEADPKRHLKKLKGSDNPAFYSLRVGDYRTILSVIDDLLVIHVVAVGLRVLTSPRTPCISQAPGDHQFSGGLILCHKPTRVKLSTRRCHFQ